MTRETPQFFTNRDGRRLFSVLHRPQDAGARGLAVVVCAPLFEEKLWSHRVLVHFARHLASQGVAVLRFDYFGDGESEGRFEDASVDSRLRDVADAVHHCRAQTDAGAVALVGLGYGGTLAVSAGVAPEAGIAGVVAWSPVIDGDRYVNDLLRANLSAQMVVHRKVIHDREALIAQILDNQPVSIEGYEIGRELFTQMRALDLLATLRDSRRPMLVQQIAPAPRVESQYAALPGLGNPAVKFEVVTELKFWTQQKNVFPPCAELFARTHEWLSAQARA
jgi:alpha/beta superfamily hydrolase